MHPATISRRLREDGFRVVSDHSREGMRIKRGIRGARGLAGAPSVVAQYDSDTQAIRHATEAAERLREMGYIVEQSGIVIHVIGEREV